MIIFVYQYDHRSFVAVFADYLRYGGYWATGRTAQEAEQRLRSGDYGIRRAQEFAE